MADKPILFSGPMVRAILNSRKTVTRRVFKGDIEWLAGAGDDRNDPENWGMVDEHGSIIVLDQSKPPYPGCGNGRPHEVFRWAAPWQVGDRLWESNMLMFTSH